MHELGHALYDQGLDAAHYGTPMGDAASLGLHESQSRMWENLVGRSEGFWQHFYPRLRSTFHESLHDVALETFRREVNHVAPGLDPRQRGRGDVRPAHHDPVVWNNSATSGASMSDSRLRLIAPILLVVGALLGMAGTFVPSANLRALCWGVDGTALTVAAALLTIHHVRRGNDLAAVGFLVFAVGEGLILSGTAMDLAASAPSFGAGAGLWAASLVLVSADRVMPPVVRGVGLGWFAVVRRRGGANLLRERPDAAVTAAAVFRVSVPGSDVVRLGVGALSICSPESSTPADHRLPPTVPRP